MHSIRRDIFTLALTLGCPVPVAGQQALQESPIDPSTFRVPIHTSAPDPVGGEYGIWAVGPDYKVSFHDGFAFYPALGPDAPRHLPLHWSTESIRVGGRELAAGKPEETWTDWRFERRHAGVIEAYDVRVDGVEQTFTLLRRPRAAGDLVVTGRVRSPLTAARLTDAHGELVFRDGAEPVIRYGRAWAIDAADRKVPMTTSFDGERIRLRLGSAFLESAAYPLTVDPLTSLVHIASGAAGSALTDLTVASETGTTSPRVLIGFSRTTGADTDAFAVAADHDYSNPTVVFADTSTSWLTSRISVCYVGGIRQWVIGLQRSISGTNQVRAYVQSTLVNTTNSGNFLRIGNAPSGSAHVKPEVGGMIAGPAALLVFERQTGSSSTVWGIRMDTIQQTVQPPFPLTNFGQPVLEEFSDPDVIELSTSPSDWIVTFVARDIVRNRYRVRASRVDFAGTVTQPTRSLELLPSGWLARQPKVAGAGERYLVTFAMSQSPLQNVRLRAIRLDWSATGAVSTPSRRTLLDEPASTAAAPAIVNHGLAYDFLTRSHWALAYTTNGTPNQGTRVARAGFSGALTEVQILRATPQITIGGVQADVSFSRPASAGQFQVVDFENVSGHPVYGRRFVYPNDALSAPFGTSCAPAGVAVESEPPYAGSEFFEVRLTGLPPQTLAFYLLSLSPDNAALTSVGMPGCFRNVRLPALATFWDVAGAGGTAAVSYPLPDDPLITGDVYSQWFWLAPGANPAGILAHHGVRHQIR